MLITAKIITTFLTVIMLSSVARRLGPQWAGVLAGFPLGSAITLYFIGYEQGAEFAATGSKHTLAGLISCIFMAAMYWHTSQRWPQPRLIFLPILAAIGTFIGTSLLLQWLPSERWLNLCLVIIAIIISRNGLKHIPASWAEPEEKNLFQRPLIALVFRASMASASVLGITALAHFLNPEQAGLLAAFPVSFFPTLIVLQLSYGHGVVATAVKHYPEGLGAMVIYVLTASYTYTAYGLNMGTLLALGSAIIYLSIYSALSRANAE